MDLDTGLAVSIVPASIFKDLFNDLDLQPTKIQLPNLLETLTMHPR